MSKLAPMGYFGKWGLKVRKKSASWLESESMCLPESSMSNVSVLRNQANHAVGKRMAIFV